MKTQKFLFLTMLFLSILSCKADEKRNIILQESTKVSASKSNQSIKVALLLDTSSSMDGLIDQAKAQLWEIVNELSYAKYRKIQPNLEIALYEYGNDNLSEANGYIRKILDFSNDLDEVSKQLFSLTTNGGNEYCGTVIKSSLDELEWGSNEDDLKMIFIAGNEPFTQGAVDFRDAAKQAKEKDVVVNTIFCGDFSHGVNTKWQEGAQLTYGDYIAINHNQQTVHIPSPYDDVLLQLNIQLNANYVPYGNYGKEKATQQLREDENAEDYSKANAVSRTVSKGSHFYNNAAWDLVDASMEKDFNYEDLKNEDLPEKLKGKKTKDIKLYIEKQKEERKKIQTEISKLSLKRKEFLAGKIKNNTNGLERAMIEGLKKQVKKKNYTWD